MKHIEMCFTALLAIAVLAAGCTSDPVAEPSETPTAEVAEPTVAPLPTPTESAVEPDPTATSEPPTVTDDERIAAAVAALDADVEADGEVSDLIAYDFIDASVVDDGSVTLTVCGWTGETVFDDVYDSVYRTNAQPDGSITTNHITTAPAAGDCTNTELVESAFDIINEYDDYWREVLADPALFELDDKSSELVDSTNQAALRDLVDQLQADETYLTYSVPKAELPGSAVADVLWRTRNLDDRVMLEIVVCRDMDPASGIYRDGVLLDAEQPDDVGPHSVKAYTMSADESNGYRWRIRNIGSLGWADCLSVSDFPSAADAWRGSPPNFEVLAS